MEQPSGTQMCIAVIAIAVCYLFVKLYKSIIWWRSYLSFYSKIQGPDYHLIWGHAFIHPGPNEEGLKYDLAQTTKYKTHYLLYLGRWRPTVVIVHPESLKKIVRTAFPKQFQGGGYQLMLPWLGKGLLLSGGQQWGRNRRLLTPAFHFDILKTYIPVYNEAVDILIDKWAKESAAGESIEISEPISLMTLDVMLKCAFNYEANIQKTGNTHEYLKAVRFLNDEIYRRLYDPKILKDFIYFNTPMGRKNRQVTDYVHQFSTQIIQNRQKQLADDNKKKLSDNNTDLSNGDTAKNKFIDFLDILLLARDADGEGLNDLEIRQEVDTFLFEGHDTTKAAISWALYALATNPECQAKCYEEVAAVFANKGSNIVNLDDINEIPYLNMCIKESMRLYTTVPLIGREVVAPTNICGTEFPAGTLVFLYLHMLHNNPHVWGEDHNVFKPERFLPENMADKDPYAYLPFSGGPRNCIGQHFAQHEMKVTLMKIILNFELVADKERPAKPMPSTVLLSSTGNYVYLKKRN